MNITAFKTRNFRRLKNTLVTLHDEVTIFVGANNSGKTSATQAFKLFSSGSTRGFKIHDFSSDCWEVFDKIGSLEAYNDSVVFPTMSLDLWFAVSENDLYRIIDLLPSLEWTGTEVGMRIQLSPKNPKDLFDNYKIALEKGRKQQSTETEYQNEYQAWPVNLSEYLGKTLSSEYELQYFVLDITEFDSNREPINENDPLRIPSEVGSGNRGAQILNSLVKIDFVAAQRFLSEDSSGQAENLSNRLSNFYQRNLDKQDDDFEALAALASAEKRLNKHLDQVFRETLSELQRFGYGGNSYPSLLIKTTLDPTQIMKSPSTTVQYGLSVSDSGEAQYSLPDSYNGLGFKNLIYIVVEIIDLHYRWKTQEVSRPPLHVIFIEEPEAHLHVQIQQVFIRKVFSILEDEGNGRPEFSSQLCITTHSPHILFEKGFKHIRYFRRCSDSSLSQRSEVLDVWAFYKYVGSESGEFLQRYMKVTNCDLFFADAAILVEGNVERLLLPSMIAKEAASLLTQYLSIMEVGGAYAHRFRELIEFLGLTTLVITDIDSVVKTLAAQKGGVKNVTVDSESEVDGETEDDDDGNRVIVEMSEAANMAGKKQRFVLKACPVDTEGAVTSNETLKQWLPQRASIVDLLNAQESECTQEPNQNSSARIRVCYQRAVSTTWGSETLPLCGRTLEEAFALENLVWCQDPEREILGLRVNKGRKALSLDEVAGRLFRKVKADGFGKTSFALGVLADVDNQWVVPSYIAGGLKWLEERVNILNESPLSAVSQNLLVEEEEVP